MRHWPPDAKQSRTKTAKEPPRVRVFGVWLRQPSRASFRSGEEGGPGGSERGCVFMPCTKEVCILLGESFIGGSYGPQGSTRHLATHNKPTCGKTTPQKWADRCLGRKTAHTIFLRTGSTTACRTPCLHKTRQQPDHSTPSCTRRLLGQTDCTMGTVLHLRQKQRGGVTSQVILFRYI